MTIAYVESSALVKLVLDEPERPALAAALARRSRLSSSLALVEVPRAVARPGGDPARARARAVLLRIELVDIDKPILERASELEPPSLRSLDAIHVATALAVDDPGLVFYSYDHRTIAAAEANGLAVASPGV